MSFYWSIQFHRVHVFDLAQSWNFQIFPEVPLTLKIEVQLLQVEVQFSGASMIQHINLIWGTKT